MYVHVYYPLIHLHVHVHVHVDEDDPTTKEALKEKVKYMQWLDLSFICKIHIM